MNSMITAWFAATLVKCRVLIVFLFASVCALGAERPNILFIRADDMGWQDTSVPLLVRWPDVARAASACEIPVLIYDWFPTLLQVAGAEAKDSDGRNLRPLLEGKADRSFDRPLVWHFPNFWGDLHHPGPREGPGLGPSSTLRCGDWKLIYYHIDRRFELFDLANDLGEKNNPTKDQPQRVRDMAAELTRILQQHRAPMPVIKATSQPVPWPVPLSAATRRS
ncbi:MAG: hypothetical protein FJ395_16040 [Verrucomicrobia bacterium]|nr:hypothetical protein [Verrucomicrobiota bacterium]